MAIAAMIASRVVAIRVLGDVPHVMDEIAYTFQARTLAEGRLTAEVALPRSAFALWFVDDRVARFGIFPPGWPAMLALGVKLGLRGWVNPFLHGLTVLLVARLARRLGGRRASGIAAAIYGFSPQALLLAASLMSHSLVAFASASALVSAFEARRGRARSWVALFVGGASVALAFLTRPLCGVAIGIVFGALVFRWMFGRARRRVVLSALAMPLVPLVLAAILLGGYNRALTGSAVRFPQSEWFDEHAPPSEDRIFAYHPGCNDLGLGKEHGCELSIGRDGHTAKNALSNTGDNLTAWFYLAGGGPLVVALAALGFRRRRGRAVRGVVFGSVPVVVVAYALYWYAGVCYGARFYHAALPPLLVVAGIGVAEIGRPVLRRALLVAVLLGNGLAFGAALREVRVHYWGTDARFARLSASWREPPALVMVAFREEGAPSGPSGITSVDPRNPRSIQPNSWRILSALGMNGPAMDDRVVFAKFHPALVPELRARFGARRLYLYLMTVDPSGDQLERYERVEGRFHEDSTQPPPPNFDGFVLGRL